MVKGGGSSNYDYGYGIAVGSHGNAYVTGSFWSDTATFGGTSLTTGMADIFVAKLDSFSVIQEPNHEWKSGFLCRVEVLCFQKMVNSADDSDQLTYIDQEVFVTVPNTDGTESVNAIITDQNGAIVLRQPMTCTHVGGSSTCTGDIAIEAQEVKAYFDETIGEIVHDGLAEFFKSDAVDSATSIFVTIAIPVICTVVGIVAGFFSAGTVAIPAGAGCIHALWGLYYLVTSITFLLSLVTYYNIVDDKLGSFENKVFPNRYISAIEVNGVTQDMVDVRLDRLNDVSESELQALGNRDSLEFIGLSPIDFQLSRNGATLTDDEDLLRISGDTAFEMMLVIDPENNDAVSVEGTGDGTYSIIGIYNDADIPVGNYDDEEAVFATLFMAEEDESISDGQKITYLEYDSSNWNEEVEVDSSAGATWVTPLMVTLIILSIISLAGASIMLLKRSRRKNETQTTKLPEGMPARGQPLPNANWKGVWGEDGYERLEHPPGSGVWYWRDQQTGHWVKY